MKKECMNLKNMKLFYSWGYDLVLKTGELANLADIEELYYNVDTLEVLLDFSNLTINLPID